MKKVMINTECARCFTIELDEIAKYRANIYQDRDDTTFKEEYDFLMNDESEATDWLFNNMDWYECRTLKEVTQKARDLDELEVDDYHVYSDTKL